MLDNLLYGYGIALTFDNVRHGCYRESSRQFTYEVRHRHIEFHRNNLLPHARYGNRGRCQQI